MIYSSQNVQGVGSLHSLCYLYACRRTPILGVGVRGGSKLTSWRLAQHRCHLQISLISVSRLDLHLGSERGRENVPSGIHVCSLTTGFGGRLRYVCEPASCRFSIQSDRRRRKVNVFLGSFSRSQSDSWDLSGEVDTMNHESLVNLFPMTTPCLFSPDLRQSLYPDLA